MKKTKENNIKEYETLTTIYKPKSRKQWTNTFGEELVKFLLYELKYDIFPKTEKIKTNSGFYRLDIETKESLYEIKTRNWTTSGSAGEKILGAPFKYCEIPIIAKKPIKIILVAYQEYEADKQFRLFDSPSYEKNIILKLYKSMNIEYIRCSDLLYKYLYSKVINSLTQRTNSIS